MIVDDDQYVIQKIAEGIDWEEIGIRRVFTADNVRQACKTFETFPIDILVTDIEMPQGSGLELLQWVQEKKYPVESLVLSGYAHFAYAQKAMQYGSRKYILKPVSNKELVTAIREIVEEKGSKYEISEIKKNSLQVAEELAGTPADQVDLVKECVEKRKMYRGSERFRIVLLRILTENKGEAEEKLFEFVVNNMIQEFFENKGLEPDYDRREPGGGWLLVFRENGRLASLREYTVQMQNCLREMVQLDSCVYMGRLCGLKDLPESYETLMRLSGEAIPDEQGLFSEEDWMLRERGDIDLPDFGRLGERMDMPGSIPEIKEELKDYICSLSEAHRATAEIYREFLEGLMTMVFHALEQREIIPSLIFNQEELDAFRKKAGRSVKWMLEFLDYLFDKLEGFQSINSSKQEYLVDRLKCYIADHLGEELSRRRLAKVVYLSEDYVSRLFSAETGMSLSNYVTKQRMEQARKYLDTTKMTVSNIAMKVGYSNFSYFSKTFKDYTGKTPNEYRNYSKKTGNYQ